MKFFRELKVFMAALILSMLTILFLPGMGTPVLANETGTLLEVTAVPLASAAVLSLGGYMLWKNRLSYSSDKPGSLGYRGPGEFYFGGFLGASFVPDMDWNNKKQTSIPFPVTAHNIGTDPGLAGGIKVGYFLDSCPYLGFEGEGSIANHNQPRQTITISPLVNGTNVAVTRPQGMLIWTMAFHILGRYGFLKDQEVPFGRLQPYVGIGPNVGVLYFESDSCKNFSLDLEAGIRYMFTKHFGAFIEYKYFHQWDVQLGTQFIFINGKQFNLGNAGWEGKQTHFDFDNHKVVIGLEYHF